MSMKEKKAVIFDVDGLLLNTEFVWLECWLKVGEDHRMPEFGPLFHKAVGTNGIDTQKMLDRELPHVSEEDRRRLLDEVHRYGLQVPDERLGKMPGVTELLDDLQAQDYRVAVATTTRRDLTEHRLKKEGIYDCFEFILCGDEVVKRKPHPEIYRKVVAALGLQPEEVLVLEDTGLGVASANAAGCDVIMVPSVNEPTETDKKRAYSIEKDLFAVKALIRSSFVCANGKEQD